MRNGLRTVLSVVLVLALAPWAAAHPLAEKVPADAIAYVAWRGAKSMGPGYETSHLKAVLEESAIPQVINEVLPAFIRKMAEQGGGDFGEAAGALEAVGTVYGAMWNHPTALYVGPVNLDGPMPLPKVALLCQAGADGEAMVAQVRRLQEQAPAPPPVPFSVNQYGGLVVIAFGAIGDREMALFGGPQALAPATALKVNPTFLAANASLHKDPVFSVYVDAKAILKTIDHGVELYAQQVAEFSPRQAAEIRRWPVIRDALGLSGLERIAMTSGFRDRNWVDQVFVEAHEPRVGLLSLLNTQPLSDDALRAVPQSAALAGAGHLDLAALMTELRTAVRKIEPRAVAELDEMLAEMRREIGLDIEADILRPLGPQWAYYTDKHVGGNGLLGVVIVNRLREPARAEITLGTIAGKLNQMLAGFSEDEMQLRIKETTADGLKINYLATPFVTPAWAIRDGNLYVALYPQVVAAAADQVSAGRPSILNNERFAAMRREAGAASVGSFGWVDVPNTIGDGYQSSLMISRLFAGMSDMMGVDAPAMVLPPMHKLRDHLSPVAGFSWADERGWYLRSTSPFPGASFLGTPGNAMMGQNMMMLGMMMPALGAARMTAQSVESTSNLRQIALAMHTWSADHDERFPQKITPALFDYLGDASVLTHPRSGAFVPIEPDQQWIDGNSAYVFVAGGKKLTEFDNTTEAVLVFEKVRWAQQGMISVAFADGHVERMPIEAVDQLLRKQTGKGINQWDPGEGFGEEKADDGTF